MEDLIKLKIFPSLHVSYNIYDRLKGMSQNGEARKTDIYSGNVHFIF